MRQLISNHIKNFGGWKTKRKLLAFAVDDYGNIRLASKKAKENLIKSGIKLSKRFDQLDALDTTDDYNALFEVLSSVRDKNGNPAIFTPYALPCNIDFEKSRENGFYVGENLNQTYAKAESEFQSAFNNTFSLMREGIDKNLIRPQFHGREHLNLFVVNKLFEMNDSSLIINIENKSMAGVNSLTDFPNIKFSESFAFEKVEQTTHHEEVITDGLRKFKEVYGYDSITFTPPGQEFFTENYGLMESMGVRGFQKGRHVKRINKLGKVFIEKAVTDVLSGQNHVSIVRNATFEPIHGTGVDWISFAAKQVDAAFFWNKPAIISSHRVNFCGHIDEDNRKLGLAQLKSLLMRVVARHPDVEFIALDDLTKTILKERGIYYL